MHRIEGENVAWSGDAKSSFRTDAPFTVMTPQWATSVQEELMKIIEDAGLPILGQNNDTRDQLLLAMKRVVSPYDYVVNSQVNFNTLFERTAANSYRIKSEYSSVLFKKVTGGYSITGILSGGDTWGEIYTNACEHLDFQNGAFISYGSLPGGITVNTDYCYLNNVEIRGNGTSSTTTVGFTLLANHVTYFRCKCSNILASGSFIGFTGSATSSHSLTSKYIGCSVFNITASDNISGYSNCWQMSGCSAYNLVGGGLQGRGFSACSQLSQCTAYNISGATNTHGFDGCTQLSSCAATTISASSYANGFNGCGQISACYAYSFTGSPSARGFYTCVQISSCSAYSLDASNTASGFVACSQISSCSASTITGVTHSYGFASCTYGAALYTSVADNPSNDWIDTVDASITNKVSTPSIWT